MIGVWYISHASWLCWHFWMDIAVFLEIGWLDYNNVATNPCVFDKLAQFPMTWTFLARALLCDWVSRDSIIKETVNCKYCGKRISDKLSWLLLLIPSGMDCNWWPIRRSAVWTVRAVRMDGKIISTEERLEKKNFSWKSREISISYTSVLTRTQESLVTFFRNSISQSTIYIIIHNFKVKILLKNGIYTCLKSASCRVVIQEQCSPLGMTCLADIPKNMLWQIAVEF